MSEAAEAAEVEVTERRRTEPDPPRRRWPRTWRSRRSTRPRTPLAEAASRRRAGAEAEAEPRIEWQKKRVHEIAKAQGLSSKEVIAALKAAGVEAKRPPRASRRPTR